MTNCTHNCPHDCLSEKLEMARRIEELEKALAAKKIEVAHAWMAHHAVGDELEILQTQLANNGWTECAKNNPKERGAYLTLAFDYGLPTCPSYRILNYGTSRKWDNGRDKLNPPESRVKYWKPLLPPVAHPNQSIGGQDRKCDQCGVPFEDGRCPCCESEFECIKHGIIDCATCAASLSLHAETKNEQ